MFQTKNDKISDAVKKWERAIKGFTESPGYPDFIKKCEEFVKEHSKEILVDETTEYKEVTGQ